MIKLLLVDDDAGNRDYLGELLHVYTDVEVIGEAGSIADAKDLITQHSPDLLFLDVEMPGGSGFELLQQLGTWPFAVIFTTAFQRYAIQAIRFSALDYLLKPVQPDELEAALLRYREKRSLVARSAVQQQFLANIRQSDISDMKLTLSVGERVFFIAPADVTHCVADDNYTELRLDDGRHFVSARTLKDYEDMLAPLGFLRVHRSTLVNRTTISHVDQSHVVLKGGARIEISRRKRDEVIRALAS
ncbi:MAG: LytTR family DNA-binding domain-containing protein [Flavobacteriales bacterium]